MKTLRRAWLLGALLLSACGSDDDNNAESQSSARDQATRAACDKLAECGRIGAGQDYETRESCEIDQRASWERTWPPASCDGHIDTTALNACLVAIQTAQCGNALDLLNIYANKCTQANVCGS